MSEILLRLHVGVRWDRRRESLDRLGDRIAAAIRVEFADEPHRLAELRLGLAGDPIWRTVGPADRLDPDEWPPADGR